MANSKCHCREGQGKREKERDQVPAGTLSQEALRVPRLYMGESE